MKTKMIKAFIALFVALTVRADYLRKVESLIESENGTLTTNVSFVRMSGEAQNLTTDIELKPVKKSSVARAEILETYPVKIPGMGSDRALREYMAVFSTEATINVYQEDLNGDQTLLTFGGDYSTGWKNYSEYLTQIHKWIVEATEIGVTNRNYNPSLPIRIFWVSIHQEYVREVGEFFAPGTAFGSISFNPTRKGEKWTVPDGVLGTMLIQFPRNVPFRFREPKGWVENVVIEVFNKSGQKVLYKDTFYDPTEYDVWLHYGLGAFYMEPQHLKRGGPQGVDTVKITLIFRDGRRFFYDGSGDLIVPKLEIVLDSDGKPLIAVRNTEVGQEVQIQSGPSINGPWTNWPVTISEVRPAVFTPGKLNEFFRIKP